MCVCVSLRTEIWSKKKRKGKIKQRREDSKMKHVLSMGARTKKNRTIGYIRIGNVARVGGIEGNL